MQIFVSKYIRIVIKELFHFFLLYFLLAHFLYNYMFLLSARKLIANLSIENNFLKESKMAAILTEATVATTTVETVLILFLMSLWKIIY